MSCLQRHLTVAEVTAFYAQPVRRPMLPAYEAYLAACRADQEAKSRFAAGHPVRRLEIDPEGPDWAWIIERRKGLVRIVESRALPPTTTSKEKP